MKADKIAQLNNAELLATYEWMLANQDKMAARLKEENIDLPDVMFPAVVAATIGLVERDLIKRGLLSANN